MSDMTGLHRMRQSGQDCASEAASHKEKSLIICGLLEFYQDYIFFFAIIAVPLTDLTKKEQPNFVEWGEAQEKAFNTLSGLY